MQFICPDWSSSCQKVGFTMRLIGLTGPYLRGISELSPRALDMLVASNKASQIRAHLCWKHIKMSRFGVELSDSVSVCIQ